ncbi:polysaccharide pyruvyl transferase family protein [Arthrobacter sp. zg-Y859]|uniref:Polysaccharide pyruvyl transferase family protein n=1 Tax=Arthrobacter jinronghuae TaxID=2964609 RepID=A0ABT1NX59_9MICC|nr:polysaccharide pyruvyl transferase family protein [Arthrobacter jinronghuae]MCQ1951084.1 polysaccharide pyruvyl transferase family protein [Arthrobacter jinronghuae]UWX79535.1 polysaccharide pyruvyl transferase family protein [Arthrobacter jinronghuae]
MGLQEIQDTTLNILSTYLRPGERVALVDFPNHGNSGDSLIYLGELMYLSRLGVHLDYVADASRYTVDDLRRRVPVGPILINGGGNFGDRWSVMQEMRERVIADFPDRRIIQLPQSIEFSAGPALEQAQSILGRHSKLTLLIRDHSGVRRAKELFPSATVEFCPDMAFGYGSIATKRVARHEVMVLKRRDSESVEPDIFVDPDQREEDWGLTGWRKVLGAALRAPGAFMKRVPVLANFLYPIQRRCYDALARLHVLNAIRLLATGRVVVTDRLHAAVISGLMGKPVVALNNANGKIGAIYSDYLSEIPSVHYVAGIDEAKIAVRKLLAQ